MTVLCAGTVLSVGGTTVVTLNWECKRSGGSNDQAAFRIVRRMAGQADVVLPTAPNFVLAADRDVRNWTFYDVGVNIAGAATYVVQIMRLNGAGTFYAMQVTAEHFAR